MRPLLTAAEARALDDFTIREVGVPGLALMETAGRAVFGWVWREYGPLVQAGATAVFCGKGNNGGDGFVVARCLADRGCAVTAYLLGRAGEVGGDAAVHLRAYVGGGGRLVEVTGDPDDGVVRELSSSSLVVDALLGTGLEADVRGPAAAAIARIASSRKPVVSIDVPSGVSSDTGRVCGCAVHADLTVTFGWPKRGHFLHPGASRTGRLVVAEIGFPPKSLANVSPRLFALEPRDFAGVLTRPADGHKGTFGHVFVFGGSAGKGGAAGLAAWAALKAGAGLSTACLPAGVAHQTAARLPLELMLEALPWAGATQLDWGEALWEASEASRGGADALVVGPGLGTGEGARAFLERVLAEEGPPLVLDADALNLLAGRERPWAARGRPAVLTPHPGEAARLLGTSAGAVQQDRVGAAVQLADRFGCVVVLKGAATLVTSPGSPVWLVPAGNPGMATAGAGDVLAGVVGALLARGLGPEEAGRVGAFAHARAGDLAAAAGGWEGLTAGALISFLGPALDELRNGGHTDTDGVGSRALPQDGRDP